MSIAPFALFSSCQKTEINTSANPTSSAIRIYGDQDGYFLNSFEPTADGGFMFGGYTNSSAGMAQQGFIQKTDKYGNVIWKKTYGGKSLDIFNVVHVTSDGGFIAAGTTESYGNGAIRGDAHEDCYLVKMNANGDTLWQRTFGGIYDDRFFDVTETPDHGFVAVGIYDNGNDNFTYVVKVDNNGKTLWPPKQLYPNSYQSFGTSVTTGANDDIAIAGYVVKSDTVGDLNTHYPSFILLNNNGGFLDYQNVNNPFPEYKMWGSVINSGYYNYATTSSLEKIISRPDGYILVVNLEAVGPNSIMIFKVDFKGNIQWKQQHFVGKNGSAFMNSISNNAVGGLLISGGTIDPAGISSTWLLNTDANGSKLWENFLPVSEYNIWAAGAIPIGNNFAVGVNLVSAGASTTTYFGLMNIDQNGKIIDANK